MHDRNANAAEQETLRGKLTSISEKITFSPLAAPDDKMAQSYTIGEGDNLNRIARSQDLKVDWRFIQRVNKLANPGAILEYKYTGN